MFWLSISSCTFSPVIALYSGFVTLKSTLCTLFTQFSVLSSGLRGADIQNYFLYGRNPVSGGRKGCRHILKKGRKFAWEAEFFGPIWASTEDSDYVCFKAHIRASMKQIARQVELTLVKETGAIFKAYCPCKAGLAGYCSHAAALLLKICALKTPCTSKLCTWNQPRNIAKHFEPRVLSDIPFGDPEKAEEAKQHPYPGVYSASACADPEDFLNDLMAGLGAVNPDCVLYKTLSPSITTCVEFTNLFELEFSISDVVNLNSCLGTFENFVGHLYVTPTLIELILSSTRGQACNPEWLNIRQLIITASNFGSIIKQRTSTRPDNLIARLRGYKSVPPTRAVVHGRTREPEARRDYVKNHIATCGGRVEVRANIRLHVDLEHPFLGASLDGLVTCSKCGTGALEIKCPYKWRHTDPGSIKDQQFCSAYVDGTLKLKRAHNYFYQVMGQMGVAQLSWADFFIWTPKGRCVERIYFDENVWLTEMVPSLTKFYTENFVAELFTRRVERGKPLYPV